MLSQHTFADTLETIQIGRNHCAYENSHRITPGPLRLFSSDSEAQQVANRILSLQGMSLDNANFVLKAAIGNRIRNAAAVVQNHRRYLLYKQSFIQDANRRAGTDWAGISIMAHEIAHHMHGHTLLLGGSRPEDELYADRWSGFVLYKLGASRDEATAAVRTIAPARETPTHPGRAERVDAIIHGWTNAREYVRETPDPIIPQVPEPEMVSIRGGTFMMGSPTSETGRDSDEKQHSVTVGDFHLGKTEVTVGEFKRFVQANNNYKTTAESSGKGCYAWNGSAWKENKANHWKNPGFKQSDRHPVTCVSADDAAAYAQWLSSSTGKRYALPTEAQWEYAARAGTTTSRYWGDNPDQACQSSNVADQAAKKQFNWTNTHNCNDSAVHTAQVGRYRANGFGLHDMMGNVWEWTCSDYNEKYGGQEQRCAQTGSSAKRVLCGGSWGSAPGYVRSAYRFQGHRGKP